MNRPLRLRRHVRPLRRGPGEVQFGVCDEHGLVLGGLAEGEADALTRLAECDTAAWLHVAARAGLSAQRQEEALRLLSEARVLGPPDGWGAAAGAPTTVRGTGPLADQIRASLHRAGCPVASPPPHMHTGAEQEGGVTVLVVDEAVPAADSHDRGTRALVVPVVASEHRATVGPVVGPSGAPCLWCLELHRAGRDPAWPTLLGQLAPLSAETAPSVHLHPALVPAVAGLVTLVVRAVLADAQVPRGRSWELDLPWPDVTTRTWHVHPRCPGPHGR